MCRALNAVRVQHCESCGVTLHPSSALSSTRVPAAPPVEVLQDTVDTVIPEPIAAAAATPGPSPTAAPEVEAIARRIDTPMSAVTSHPDVGKDAEGEEIPLPVTFTSVPHLRPMARVLGLAVAIAAALVLAYQFGARPEVFVANAHRVGPALGTAPALVLPGPLPAAQAQKDPPFAAWPNAAPSVTPEIPSGMGLLKTATARPGRRIFVGGHLAGQTPHSVLVKCGRTTLKIGSTGRSRAIDVPCGQEISLDKT
jgi:hypothetical protein